MAGHNSDNERSINNSASLAHAHLSRNISPSLLSENFSKNSLVSIVDPQISFYFSNSVSPEMLEQMKRRNEIASQQLATSVALVQIELKKLESQLRLESSQLRQEVVANYDRVFVNAKGSDAADRLFVHSSMHALALIGMKLKSLHKTRQLSTDLSAEIAIIMLHASPKEQEKLVEAFAHEYFLGFNGAGSFQQALNTLRENIERRIAEAEAAETKRIAEAEAAEAKRLSANDKALIITPQRILSSDEWKQSFSENGPLRTSNWTSNFGEYHAILSTLLYYVQQGDIQMERKLFGAVYYIAGVKVGFYDVINASFQLTIGRQLLSQAGQDLRSGSRFKCKDALLQLYPHYEKAVEHYYGVSGVMFVLTAYAFENRTSETFGMTDYLKLPMILTSPSEYQVRPILHRYAMNTAPDYVAFIAALQPYYSPDWAK